MREHGATIQREQYRDISTLKLKYICEEVVLFNEERRSYFRESGLMLIGWN